MQTLSMQAAADDLSACIYCYSVGACLCVSARLVHPGYLTPGPACCFSKQPLCLLTCMHSAIGWRAAYIKPRTAPVPSSAAALVQPQCLLTNKRPHGVCILGFDQLLIKLGPSTLTHSAWPRPSCSSRLSDKRTHLLIQTLRIFRPSASCVHRHVLPAAFEPALNHHTTTPWLCSS